jgi:hypothetical protein
VTSLTSSFSVPCINWQKRPQYSGPRWWWSHSRGAVGSRFMGCLTTPIHCSVPRYMNDELQKTWKERPWPDQDTTLAFVWRMRKTTKIVTWDSRFRAEILTEYLPNTSLERFLKIVRRCEIIRGRDFFLLKIVIKSANSKKGMCPLAEIETRPLFELTGWIVIKLRTMRRAWHAACKGI